MIGTLLQIDGRTLHKDDHFTTSWDSLFIKGSPLVNMNGYIQKGLALIVLSYTIRYKV